MIPRREQTGVAESLDGMSLNFQSSPKFCVNLCPFQVGTNAKSKEMALQTEPKLELREKNPMHLFHGM